MQASVLKEYYIRYLCDIRNLSQSSVKHYLDALNNISRYLVEKCLVTKDIYEIMDVEKLASIRDILYSDPDFMAQDKRGHQMYSAGLNNYFRFASGDGFAVAQEKILLLDTPIVISTQESRTVTTWKRSGIVRNQALEMAGFSCEINRGHESFIAENTTHKYMEGHHAIPMKWQGEFRNSLDIYANIVCLCPLCHRKIHYGMRNDKIQMMQQLYTTRAARLAQSGIHISKDDFISTIL